MRKIVITGFIVALCLLIIPLIGIKGEKKAVKTSAVSEKAEKEAPEAETYTENAYPDTVFRIKTDGGINEITATEYVTGVVAAEMPADFSVEALKAQCVAAYTFALYRKGEGRYDGYDLTDSYKTDQSYIDEEKRKEKWGEAYEEKQAKINAAVAAVNGEYLLFDGKPALTLYHALSGGVTNSCEDVFGAKIPYLVSVDSEGDRLSPDYKSVFSFSEDDLMTRLLPVSAATGGKNLFSEVKTAKSGLVLSLDYAGTKSTGGKIAELLGLPSAAFTVEQVDSGYMITCVGRGHGVGMSQYSAELMAKQGADYKEILYHFYPGTKLSDE